MGNNIPKQSMTYIIIFLCVILVFIFLGIVPSQRALANREENIAETNLKLEEQKILFPVYQVLKQGTEKKGAHALPLPAKVPLARNQLGRLNEAVKEIAGRAHMEVISLAPDVNSLSDKSTSIAVNVTVRGTFFSLRQLLIGIGGIPSLERIEGIQIQRTTNWMEMKVKFWVALS
jgi:hypothetical protein